MYLYKGAKPPLYNYVIKYKALLVYPGGKTPLSLVKQKGREGKGREGKGGRKEGRMHGRKDGRKGGTKEGWTHFVSFSYSFQKFLTNVQDTNLNLKSVP